MISKRSIKRSQYQDLLQKMIQTPEGAEVERFLAEDPDVEMSLMELNTGVYAHHTNSVRVQKAKLEKKLKNLGLDPQQESQPATDKPHSSIGVNEFEKLFNHLNNSDRYIDENGEEKPYYNKTSEAILSFGWDYKTCRSTNQYTEEQELSFLNDMKKLPEYEVSDKQKTRLRITARDCLTWLKRTQPSQPHANGNANGGA